MSRRTAGVNSATCGARSACSFALTAVASNAPSLAVGAGGAGCRGTGGQGAGCGGAGCNGACCNVPSHGHEDEPPTMPVVAAAALPSNLLRSVVASSRARMISATRHVGWLDHATKAADAGMPPSAGATSARRTTAHSSRRSACWRTSGSRAPGDFARLPDSSGWAEETASMVSMAVAAADARAPPQAGVDVAVAWAWLGSSRFSVGMSLASSAFNSARVRRTVGGPVRGPPVG